MHISVLLRSTLVSPHLVLLLARVLSSSLACSRFPRVTLSTFRPLLLLLEGDAFFCRQRLHGMEGLAVLVVGNAGMKELLVSFHSFRSTARRLRARVFGMRDARISRNIMVVRYADA